MRKGLTEQEDDNQPEAVGLPGVHSLTDRKHTGGLSQGEDFLQTETKMKNVQNDSTELICKVPDSLELTPSEPVAFLSQDTWSIMMVNLGKGAGEVILIRN